MDEKLLERIVLESVNEKSDSIEIGTYQKGGYSRTIKLKRNLDTPKSRENIIAALKEIDSLLSKDFPTPHESKEKDNEPSV